MLVNSKWNDLLLHQVVKSNRPDVDDGCCSGKKCAQLGISKCGLVNNQGGHQHVVHGELDGLETTFSLAILVLTASRYEFPSNSLSCSILPNHFQDPELSVLIEWGKTISGALIISLRTLQRSLTSSLSKMSSQPYS